MAFQQDPPSLGNQYDSDSLLREYLERTFPAELLERFEPEYRELGALNGGELYRLSLADLENEPVHRVWDAWGNRVDEVEVTEVWKRAQVLCAEHGLVAAGYDAELGPYARVHQHILNYVAQASLDTYSCPLAMTDGAARTLLDSGNQALIDHALPRLLSRDPDTMWTSGQWMTERIGGSDVGQTETIARRDGDRWRLYGTKWFTSATTADMALTLARPEGNPPGGRGLAMFYLELRDENGKLQNLQINRLKDKFGTRKLPTAELTLDGVEAIPVAGLESGVRNITPMLNVTRTWNAVAAVLGMQRAVALTRDYANKREAFGASLIDKPLHVDTMADMIAETQGAFLLAFRVVELLGRIESGDASKAEQLLSRLLTPIGKLTTGKQAVAVASEALESFGGAGYVERHRAPEAPRRRAGASDLGRDDQCPLARYPSRAPTRWCLGRVRRRDSRPTRSDHQSALAGRRGTQSRCRSACRPLARRNAVGTRPARSWRPALCDDSGSRDRACAARPPCAVVSRSREGRARLGSGSSLRPEPHRPHRGR